MKGATGLSDPAAKQIKVSIHAPVKGATSQAGDKGAGFTRFNPRAREGRDPMAPSLRWPAQCFNPRAREGRDRILFPVITVLLCFNPRAREGRDKSFAVPSVTSSLFQSTRP